MAKRRQSETIVSVTEHKIEDFADDLGRLLGTAQSKAQGWLGQRKQIAATLEGIRDTASSLLSELGHRAERVVRRGRPKAHLAAPPKAKRKRRKMSAAARAKISAAQKKRWAAFRTRTSK